MPKIDEILDMLLKDDYSLDRRLDKNNEQKRELRKELLSQVRQEILEEIEKVIINLPKYVIMIGTLRVEEGIKKSDCLSAIRKVMGTTEGQING